jgi:hypothetical protein
MFLRKKEIILAIGFSLLGGYSLFAGDLSSVNATVAVRYKLKAWNKVKEQ